MTGKTLTFDDSIFNSYLSLRPLIESLKKMIAEGNPGTQKLYGDLITRIEQHPELLEPISDLSILEPHKELGEMLLATIFPPAASENENLYAVSVPFKFKAIYASKLFKMLFMTKDGLDMHDIQVPDDEIGMHLSDEKLLFAYKMILRKYAGYQSAYNYRSVHPFIDPVSGLVKYMELNVDTRFVDVKPADELPDLPDNIVCKKTNRLMTLEQLKETIPLEKFKFEGLAIVRINDITEQEIISQIKNSLLSVNAFSDTSVYSTLQTHMQSLLGLKDVKIGITPFFKVNGHYVYSALHNSNSLLYKEFKAIAENDMVNECCVHLFAGHNRPIAFESITDDDVKEYPTLDIYRQQGAKSLIICPLKHEDELMGVLEIVSEMPNQLQHHHIAKIEAALPLFTFALEKSEAGLDNQVDKVIKEKFTAVQPAVEWKFTEAALNYIVGKQHDENIKVERIAFEDVYPLYGAIDIRNSSVERAHSIQLDLIEQLEMARTIIKKAQKKVNFPLLQEIEFKIDKYILSASDILQNDDEMLIHDFLQDKVVTVFENLKTTAPDLKKDIADYYAALDPQQKMIYHHRKFYEESMAKINDKVSKFIDTEQKKAQEVYPFYFERYVTDGVEFNAYIGQSMSPTKKFSDLYLRNLKMWQLTTLAKAAQLTNKLEAELSLPLSTTQLILAHSVPISISFRTAERKFDVDGAYNIRYEIIKKRIDKVHIKENNERFTQPGKLAIVYSQPREAAEYREYIEFLQNQHLLKPGIEEFELEELQGVVGLKGLRVEVNFEEEQKIEKKIKLSAADIRIQGN
jgi:hypothetical protein